MQDADVDLHRTNQWLTSGGLKGETAGLIIAAQDQGLVTRLYHSNIIKDVTHSLCKKCSKFDDSVDHIICGRLELAKKEYAASYPAIGTCARAITSRQLTNGKSINRKRCKERTSNDFVEYANSY